MRYGTPMARGTRLTHAAPAVARRGRDMPAAEYRHLARTVAEILLTRHPIPRLPRAAYSDGRKFAEATEKEWLAEVALDQTIRVEGREFRLWLPEGDRFWVDFMAIDTRWQPRDAHRPGAFLIPFNFKCGEGRTPDNVGGQGLFRYLITGTIDPERMSPKGMKERALATEAARLRMFLDSGAPTPVREYFCLHHDPEGDAAGHRVVPITALTNPTINPKNGLQVKMATAEVEWERDTRASLLALVGWYEQYLAKMAAPHRTLIESQGARWRAGFAARYGAAPRPGNS